jgi:hypothetical protein
MCHFIKSRRVGSWIDSYSSNHCIGFWVSYFCCLIWFLRNQSLLWSKEVTNLLFIGLVYCNVSKISKNLFEYDDVLWRLIFEMFFVFLFVKWWSEKMLFEFWTFFFVAKFVVVKIIGLFSFCVFRCSVVAWKLILRRLRLLFVRWKLGILLLM